MKNTLYEEERLKAIAYFDEKDLRDKKERDKEKRKKHRKTAMTAITCVCFFTAMVIIYIKLSVLFM